MRPKVAGVTIISKSYECVIIGIINLAEKKLNSSIGSSQFAISPPFSAIELSALVIEFRILVIDLSLFVIQLRILVIEFSSLLIEFSLFVMFHGHNSNKR